MAINPVAKFPLLRPELNTSAVVQPPTDIGAAVGTAPSGSPPGDSNDQAAEILAITDFLGYGDSSSKTVTERIAKLEALLRNPMRTIDFLTARRQEAHVPPVNYLFPNTAGRMDSTTSSIPAGTHTAATARTPLGLDQNGGLTVPLGCRWIVQGLDMWAERAWKGYYRINQISGSMDHNGLSLGYDREYGPLSGQADELVHVDLSDEQLAEYCQLIPFMVPKTGEIDLPYMGFAPRFVQVTNDPNWDAEFTDVYMGVSTGWTIPGINDGSTGKPDTRNTSSYPRGEHLSLFRERDALRQKGVNVRAVNLSFGAGNINTFAGFLRQGRWDGLKGNLFHIDTCLNDFGTSTGERDASRALYAEVGRWIKRHNPDATIILHQMGPTDVTTRNAKRANLRDAIAGAQTDLGGESNKVYICDLASAFDSEGGNTSTTAFANDETATNKVHGNILGHFLYSAAMRSTLETTSFYTGDLGLSGSLSAAPVAS